MNPRSSRASLIAGSILVGLLGFGFVLGQTAGKDSIYKYLSLFADVYTLVRGNYVDPVDEGVLMEGAYDGMTAGLDLFSGYLPRQEFSEIQRDPVGGTSYTGIEALRVPGGAVVASVSPGSSAEKAGIRPGDQIWSIEGHPTREMSLLQVRRAQRGSQNSSVKMLIYHPKTRKREDLGLRRAPESGPAYETRVLDGKIGYLRVFDMTRTDREPLRGALLDLKERGAGRLLLDLRDCARGDLEDAVRVAGLFVTAGPVVSTVQRGGAKVVKTSMTPIVWTLPISVLANGGSAGGAEALAAALRSRLKAPLLGQTTYGLGSSQELVALPSGDGLVLSTSLFVSPSGETWNRSDAKDEAWGLKPDREIEATFDEHAGFEPDRQLEKALETLRPAATAAAA